MMAGYLDPQVQIRVIDLAWDMAKGEGEVKSSPQDIIEQKTKLFTQAYETIVNTVTSVLKSPTGRKGIDI